MHWSHVRGEEAEQKVLEELQRRGYRLVHRRLRTPVAEIDLVMASLAEYLLVEVKTLSNRGFLENRLSRGQKERLKRARAMLQERWRADVRLVLAVVDEKGKILLFNLTADDLN
jgi:Holliday junction resolvase-like predicted endonuclease